MEEPGGLRSTGSQKSGTSLSLSTSITYRNSAPLQLFVVDGTELHILCAPKHKLTILLDALVS